MKKEKLTVKAWKDGFPLSVTVFDPENVDADKEKQAVIITGATGIAQQFYAGFARYPQFMKSKG